MASEDTWMPDAEWLARDAERRATWAAIHAEEEAAALAKFRASAEKLKRRIAKYAKGGPIDDRTKLLHAVCKLDDRRVINPCLRYSAGAEELVRALRTQYRAAEESAAVARHKAYLAEDKRLREVIAEEKYQRRLRGGY